MRVERQHRWAPGKPSRLPSSRACLSLRRAGARGGGLCAALFAVLVMIRTAIGRDLPALGDAVNYALLVSSVLTAVFATTFWAAGELALGLRLRVIQWALALVVIWVCVVTILVLFLALGGLPLGSL